MVPGQFGKLLVLCLGLSPTMASAQHHGAPGHGAPYAGLQAREIASLSDEDIVEIRRGGGWGLALAAELNGLPGPAHLLELREELELTEEQISAIEEIHAAMRAEAIAAGERFIEAEAALNAAFAAGDVEEVELRALVDAAASARAELRFVHLSNHLGTRPLLFETQVDRYQILRGYADDPCTTVPEGHDPVMWRRHNGCD